MTHLIFPLENLFQTWEFFGQQSNKEGLISGLTRASFAGTFALFGIPLRQAFRVRWESLHASIPVLHIVKDGLDLPMPGMLLKYYEIRSSILYWVQACIKKTYDFLRT